MSDISTSSAEKLEQLVDAAIEARKNAYAPYSKFHVGAAVLTAEGQVFSGVNVENSSFGLTICAERVAACSAVAAGVRDLVALAVATPGGHSPCGACRQFLHEFGDELLVLLVDSDGEQSPRETSIAELLPAGFRFQKKS